LLDLPLYSELAATFGIRADLLGTIVGLAAALSIACQIPVGVLIDRLGARPFLVAGLATTTVVTVIRAMAPNIVAFALGQMLMGLAVPLYAAGSITALAAAYGGMRRGTPLATSNQALVSGRRSLSSPSAAWVRS
jgi:predicted MFS family arabinose efflux permease